MFFHRFHFFMFKSQILHHIYNMLLTAAHCSNFFLCRWIARVERMEALPSACVCMCVLVCARLTVCKRESQGSFFSDHRFINSFQCTRAANRDSSGWLTYSGLSLARSDWLSSKSNATQHWLTLTVQRRSLSRWLSFRQMISGATTEDPFYDKWMSNIHFSKPNQLACRPVLAQTASVQQAELLFFLFFVFFLTNVLFYTRSWEKRHSWQRLHWA